ncbi:CG18493, partial [Drosophila busckii]
LVLWALIPLAAAASLGQTQGAAEPAVSAFVQSLHQMHRGPPAREITTRANVQQGWISQKLDNFDANNTAKWYNRYLINEDYFRSGSPIFIYLGGEWEIDASSITSGLWVDIAKEHNGSLLYTEHRFFGQSIPIKPLSTANLKYQSVQQALADVINLIKTLKTQAKYKDSKVLVSGCSYSATMAVWIKKLYPDIILGSWASSAPLDAKVDFKDYMRIVGKAYRQLGSEDCYNLIDNATAYYEDLFDEGKGKEAKKLLNLCSNFDVNNERDIWQIFSTIANIFAGFAQYQSPANKDLQGHCINLRSKSDDDATALSLFLQEKLEWPSCVNTRYQGSVDYYLWAQANNDNSDIPWTYQTCSEFGWFQGSGSSRQPFGSSFPSTLYTDICHDVFGANFTLPKIQGYIDDTNAEFGGIYPNAQNLYMTHGGLDPWSKVGAGALQGATIIPQHSHCSDLGSIRKSDSAELTASKKKVKQLVRQWLQ